MNRTQYKRVPSAATFKEQVAISGGWLNSRYKNDFYKQARTEVAGTEYAQKGKKFKVPVLIGAKKETNLEEPKWTDNVFTGDNAKNAAALTFYAREREQKQNGDKKGRKTTVDETVGERLFRSSIKEAAQKAIKPKHNLLGKINLTRVNDIRRTMRIRYASRTNIDKLFQNYDTGNKGFVDAKDIHAQS